MKIHIGDPVTESNPNSTYKVVASFMHGDGAADEDVVVLIPEDARDLETFIEFMEGLKNLPWSLSYDTDLETSFETEEILFFIPWEVGNVGNSYASFNGYKLTYFDHEGSEYLTSIEK